MKFPDFRYLAPATLDEACALLSDNLGQAKIIAGGQSLLPTMAYRLAQPEYLIDIRRLDSLRHIEHMGDRIRIGAACRWVDIEKSALLANDLPLLPCAVRHIAHYQIRNRGTIGGNVTHADPASEMPCVVLTCEATLLAQSVRGIRQIAAHEFFQGALSTALEEDEILTHIEFPAWPQGRRWGFREFSHRSGDFALAGAVALYDLSEQGVMTSVALGGFGVDSTPVRLPKSQACLEGRKPDADAFLEAGELAGLEVQPMDDLHAPAAYRRALLTTQLTQALTDSVGID